MSYTRFYHIWQGMKDRCTRKTFKQYKNYGGKGIQCLWPSFDDFKTDMYPSYLSHSRKHGEANTTIERNDNNGHYCRANCRWATKQEQGANTSRVLSFDVDSQRLSFKQAMQKFGIGEATLRYRLHKRWPISKLFIAPKKGRITTFIR